MRHPFFALERPLVIAHRGASGELPENTLPAFERAAEQGAVILETDVHRSRDGFVVLSHDPAVERMTGGSGAVEELTLEELRALDAGHRFSPDGGRSFPERGRGHRIPRLSEALEHFPRMRFNVELKRTDAKLVDATLAVIRAAGADERTLLAAGEDATMRLLRERLEASGLRPAMGASTGDVLGFLRALESGGEPPTEPMALQVPPSFGGRELVSRELVDFAHRFDVQVHVWTVNEPDEMRRLLDLGVDGLMSDFPGRLRQVVDERRARGA